MYKNNTICKGMIKINLPIDIVSVNCINPSESLKALDYSSKNINFNNSYIFTSENVQSEEHEVIKIDKFKSILDYSNFMLKIGEYIKSDHVLVIQDDGHVVNSHNWSDDFLNYDYIGSPWPQTTKWRKRWSTKEYGDANKNVLKNRVGNGGFSLRSRAFLEYSSKFDSCNGLPEDVFLCLVNYKDALKEQIKFAPFDIAFKFSCEVPLKGRKLQKEGKNQNYDFENHFGWHGKRFLNSDKLLNLKNEI
jgi:hypothetical protein